MAGVSTLGQAKARIELFRDQQVLLNSLTTQLATSKKTQKFSGLGSDVLTVQRSRADIKSVETYLSNIKHADRRLQLTLDAVEAFQSHAEDLADFLVKFSQTTAHQQGELIYWDDPMTTAIEQIPVGYDSPDPDLDFQNIQSFANSVFDLFKDILNQKDGSRYIFAGAETLTRPLGDTSPLDASLNSLITQWKTGGITTDNLIADLYDGTTANGNADAITDTIIGYSAPLNAGTAGKVFVRADDRSELDFTVLANEDPFREIMIAIGYLRNESLPPIADHIDPATMTVLTEGAPGADVTESRENFFAVFQAITESVVQAIDDMDQIRFRLENTRVRIEELKENHTNEKNLLISTVSNIEDVDLNEVALSINTLSIQLEASYRVTADTQVLSLVNFLR